MVTITVAGNITRVRENIYIPKCNVRRLDKQTYCYTPTGEVREYRQNTESRTKTGSLRRTFAHLRDLIRCNFNGGKSELWITLTYAENMRDPATVSHDWDVYYKRLKRYIKKPLKYIAVLEPQERGAWHIHLLLGTADGTPLYLPDSKNRALWGHGITQTERLHDADDIGAYYQTYFTDLIGNDHKRKKAARLPLYPRGMKFYRTSLNLKHPKTLIVHRNDIARYIGGKKLPQSQSIILLRYTSTDGTTRIINAYRYTIYNTASKKIAEPSYCNICNNIGVCCETCNKMSRIVKIIDIGGD